MQVRANGERIVRIDGAVTFLDVLDDAVFINHDVRALRPLIGFALHVVSLQNAVVLEHLFVHIAEERKLDVDLLGKCGICRGRIHTYTENDCIVRIDFTGCESSLDRLKLFRSTTGEGEHING
jgi:hypothetical protein